MLSLESLQPHAILASPREGDFDRLIKLAIRVVGATAGLISLLDEEDELSALCREIVAAGGEGGHSGVILPWALHSEAVYEAVRLPGGQIAESLEQFRSGR